MWVIAFIQRDESLHKILSHIDLPTVPPVISPTRDHPELHDSIDQTTLFDGSQSQFEPEYEFDQTVNW